MTEHSYIEAQLQGPSLSDAAISLFAHSRIATTRLHDIAEEAGNLRKRLNIAGTGSDLLCARVDCMVFDSQASIAVVASRSSHNLHAIRLNFSDQWLFEIV